MMNSSFRAPIDSLEYFALLVADESKLALGETSVNLAQIQYPDLCCVDVSHTFDLIAQKARPLLHGCSGLQKIGVLNEFIYEEMHFRGLSHQVDEQIELSCINYAFEHKCGSDAIMSIFYLEMAKEFELHARPILFPGQVLIKIRLNRPNGQPAEVIINPLTGKSLNMEDIQQLLTPFKNERGLIGDYDIPSDLFLEAASSKDLIAHILLTMKLIYQNESNWPAFIKVLDRLIILHPDLIENYRERGYAFIKEGLAQKAITDLEHYLQHARTQLVTDAHIVEQELAQLRDRLS